MHACTSFNTYTQPHLECVPVCTEYSPPPPARPEDWAEYFSTILPVSCQPAQLLASQVWARAAALSSTAQ